MNRNNNKSPAVEIEREALAKYIDHTLLKPDVVPSEIERLCDEAIRYGFASVCVNPANIALAAKHLKGSIVTPCCVIAFPFGASTPESKAFEAKNAVKNGARELDMVINIGAVKAGEWLLVERDIRAVVRAAGKRAKVKVIIETAMLSDKEKVKVCRLAKLAGAAFVKTSTGYGGGGATQTDVELMRKTVGDEMGVKASGGIRSYEDAVKMIKAGATRIGASAGIKIIGKED